MRWLAVLLVALVAVGGWAWINRDAGGETPAEYAARFDADWLRWAFEVEGEGPAAGALDDPALAAALQPQEPVEDWGDVENYMLYFRGYMRLIIAIGEHQAGTLEWDEAPPAPLLDDAGNLRPFASLDDRERDLLGDWILNDPGVDHHVEGIAAKMELRIIRHREDLSDAISA